MLSQGDSATLVQDSEAISEGGDAVTFSRGEILVNIAIDSVIVSEDWFYMTLYTSILVITTKWMKNHPFCGACYCINILIFF